MKWDRLIQATYFLLRVVAGLLFMQAGGTKVFGWFDMLPKEMYPNGTVPLLSQAGIGGLLELVGGALILVGLLTRPVAFILSGEMAVAYWQFHFTRTSWWPAQNQGELAVLFCFIFLFMAAYGGGEWSLDALIWRKRKVPPAA